jgi:gliding motility-associated-like protein
MIVANGWGCRDTATVNVSILPSPTANAGNDTTICPDATIQLNGISTGASVYSWHPTKGLSDSTIPNPIITVDSISTNTTFYFVVKDTTDGCSDTDAVVINLVPTPLFDVKQLDIHCVGDSVHLVASGGDIYSWTPNIDITSITTPNTTVIGNYDAPYYVTITDLFCNRKATLPVNIALLPQPDVHINKGNGLQVDCLNPTLTITVTGADGYQWSPKTGIITDNGSTITVAPTDTITYTVLGSDTTGCKSTDHVFVNVIHDYTQGEIYAPSAFSPNQDGKNDCYKLLVIGEVEKFKFMIYDRWGNNVFYTESKIDCWDGRYNGADQPLGTYFYYYEGKTSCGKVKGKGDFTLMR